MAEFMDVVRELVTPIIKAAVTEVMTERGGASESESLWTRQQAAEYLRCSLVKLDQLVADGTVPSFMVGGSRRFVPREVRDSVRGAA